MNRHERRRAAALGSRVRQEAAPPEDIGLYWSIMRRAMAEDESGQRGPYHQAHRAIMRARRLVLTRRVTALAEDLRISDLGVTIHSFEMGVPHPGTTWMEWDAAVEGRNPPLEPPRVSRRLQPVRGRSHDTEDSEAVFARVT